MAYKLPPLPCPFCGNEPKVVDDLITFHVECSVCGSTGAVSSYESGAIEVWNRRAAIEAQGVPDVDDLRDRLVAISSAVAEQNDMLAQALIGDTLAMLASAPPAPQAKPQPLSDEQIELLMLSIGTTYADDNDERMNHRQIVRAIEAAHGITKE